MVNKFVSFYSICKELHEEESPGRDIDEYYREQRDRFKEILARMGIDIETLRQDKNGAILLPVARKENVKKLLKGYTSKAIKKVRKGDFRTMENQDLKDIVEDIEGLLVDRLEGKDRYVQMSRMYMRTRFKVDEAIDDLKRTVIEGILHDVENLRSIVNEDKTNHKTINESDRIALIHYYTYLLTNASEEFKAILSIVDDVRKAEIVEISSRMAEELTEDSKNYLISPLEHEMEDIQWVIWDAVQTYHEEQEVEYHSHDGLAGFDKVLEEIREEQKSKR